LLKQPIKASEPVPELSLEKEFSVMEEIDSLAQKLFPKNKGQRNTLITRVRDMYDRAREKNFLVIHSPGGWGCTPWEGLLGWEQSIVTGVTSTLEKLGYTNVMVQYFRSRDNYWGHLQDINKEAKFFLKGASYRAEVMSKELQFLIRRLPELKVVLVGASQGAAFNNAAMLRLGNANSIYSIELGTFLPHMPRRVLTDRTLAIDNNGLVRDPICQRDLWTGFKAYVRGSGYWLRRRLQGHPVKFTHCTNTPGHEYYWEYPAVHTRITEFLTAKFGVNHS
jgi:hypothetical protein